MAPSLCCDRAPEDMVRGARPIDRRQRTLNGGYYRLPRHVTRGTSEPSTPTKRPVVWASGYTPSRRCPPQSRISRGQNETSLVWRGIGCLLGRRHPNVAAVALDNKNARTVWALLAHGREFRPDYVAQPLAA